MKHLQSCLPLRLRSFASFGHVRSRSKRFQQRSFLQDVPLPPLLWHPKLQGGTSHESPDWATSTTVHNATAWWTRAVWLFLWSIAISGLLAQLGKWGWQKSKTGKLQNNLPTRKGRKGKKHGKAPDKTATREKVPILGRYYKSAPNRPQKAGLAEEKVRLLFHSWTAKAKKES
jgi:hypothetical protein